MISEEQVNFASSMNIVEELNRNKLIKFERIPYTIHTTDLTNKTKDMTKIIARIKSGNTMIQKILIKIIRAIKRVNLLWIRAVIS